MSIEYFEKVQKQVKYEKLREQAQAQTLEELIALGVARGYSNPHGWAVGKMKARNGEYKKW